MGYQRAGASTLSASSTNPVVGSGPAFITATSTGTITTVGNYKIHTFLSSGTFTVTAGTNKAIEYLIIAGGGGGGGDGPGTNTHYGGGGAGGFLESYIGQTEGVDFSGARIYVNTSDVFTVTVGAGGPKGTGANKGSNGANSSIAKSGSYGINAIGGGGGAKATSAAGDPGNGGSSGGHGYGSGTWIGDPAEAVISPRQGYRAWSTNYTQQTVGGGGAGGVSDINVPPSSGAPGRASSISGSSVTYSSGNKNDNAGTAIDGATNKGDGGGGASNSGVSGGGGSGIVIIRYLFQ